MSPTPEQIESDIHSTRAELHSNLQELESKVKSVTDWRQLFAKNPGAMTAGAFGVGILLATMMGGRNRSSPSIQDVARRTPAQNGYDEPSKPKHQVLQSLDNIKSAAVGLAASKITAFLGNLMPGFEGELRKVAPHDSQPSTRTSSGQTPLM